METDTPRIALIHALEESVAPARAAFADAWPEAFCFDLLDTSLAVDLAEAGTLGEPMMRRFAMLVDSAGQSGKTAGILFTCSAFGPAIDAVKAKAAIPVSRPNKDAFSQTLDNGKQFLMIVSFVPSRTALESEFQEMARQRGRSISLSTIVAEGALQALKSENADWHDTLLAQAARRHAATVDTTTSVNFPWHALEALWSAASLNSPS